VVSFLRPVLAMSAGIVLLATGMRLYGRVNSELVRLTRSFRPAPEIALADSLPALSGGLSGLEAFALSLPAGTLATFDRALWLSDSIREVIVDFHSTRNPFDSAVLYVWAAGRLHARTVRQPGGVRWRIPVGHGVSDWEEVIAFQVSRPAHWKIRHADPGISVFERVEGSVLHVLRNTYATHPGDWARPDTTYPTADSGAFALLTRGAALAAINPARDAVRLRVLGPGGNDARMLHIPPRTIQVYRNFWKGAGTLLAYTDAGRPFCVLGRCRPVHREFFQLEKPPEPSDSLFPLSR
jgi:hypothetical protein